MEWKDARYAPRGIVLETKIDDANGVRNQTTLKFGETNNLWWTPDGQMYVYYTPTHYRDVQP